MRNPKRIDVVLSHIGKYWHQHPDLRLCQIIFSALSTTPLGDDIFYIEDEQLIMGINNLSKED